MRFGRKNRRAKKIQTSVWVAKPRWRSSMEHLESRLLLSTCATPTVIDLGAVVQADASSLTAPFTPSEIRQAYGVNEISFNGTAGDGSGQTIAIVDAYNDPNIISDANTFSANYGLPQFNASGGPTLQVLNQFGGATLPSNASPGTWDVEESLDVEWAHAMAPNANIILFEANSNGTNSLYRAVTTAAGYSGVSVVSMSWHSNNAEFSGETSLDSTFTTPSGHQGVTFLASSGDVGGLAIYPSVSPNVIAVGGTSLTLNGDGSYGSESAWSDGGGGISKYESQPSYQNGKVNGDSSTNRTVPDVSMVADPNTGVFLLDTFYSSQYQQAGGTSLSAPLWAGLIAVADQGLALKGISSLNGATQTLPDLYSLPSTDFHDITTGSNGNPATVGYDMATGLGSPIANLLVPALAGYSTASTASELVFTQEPGSVTAGNAINPSVVVKIEDQNGNVLSGDSSNVTLTVNSGPGSLDGTTVTVQAQNGVATFSNLTLDAAGGYTLKASDTSDGLSNFVSNSFTVSPAAATQLVFSTQPINGVAGVAISSVVLSIEDQFGNVESGDGSSVSIAASGPASLSTSANAVKGVATFSNLTLDTAGGYTLTASDTADSLTSAASNSFTISPAAATQLVFTTQPTDGTAGVALSSVVLRIEDQFGNMESGDGSSVSIVASGPGALTGTSTTSVTAVKGVATFGNLTLDTAGGYTLQASDTTDSLTSAASNSFTISPAAATQLVFSTEPIDGIASTPLAPVVLSIEDQFGNVESGDSSAVALSIASGPFNGVFTDTSTTSVNAIEGVATFSNLTLDTVGNYALAAADATDSLSSATSNRFSITAPTATVSGQLVFVQQPTNVIAGSTINPAVMVQIEDGQGNVLTADNSQVTIAIATGPAGAVLGGTVTVQAQNGVATFTDLSLTQSGSYTFTASDATDGFVSAASSSITVTPAAATQLAFLQQPTSATAGSAITPGVTVAVEDPYGNIVTDQNSTVSLFVDGAQGPWRARHRVRFTAQVQDGVATFSDLSLRRAGTYSLVAADGRLTRAISSSFVISPAAATHLFFRRVPWFTSQGQTFIVQVVLLDQYGNVATNDTSQVTLSLGMHPASAVLSGTQSVAVVNGVATFNDLSLSAPGLYTLVATDSNAALTATSVRFCIASDNQRVAALRHGYGRCPILTSL